MLLKNKVLIFVIILASLSVCFWMGCKSPVVPKEWSNVVMYTIDTLNPAYLGAYGDPSTRSPTFDRLSQSGLQFNQAHTAINLTNPSHASILTSVHPYEHGAYQNTNRISNKFETVAEVFSKNGFATAASVGAPQLNPENSGFGQGFDVFFQCGRRHRDCADVTDNMIAWFESDNKALRRFTWLHFMDCHAPYKPPRPFSKMYPDRVRTHRVTGKQGLAIENSNASGDSKKPLLETEAFLRRPPFNKWYQGWLKDASDVEVPKNNYRSTITEVDTQIERLIHFLQDSGQWNDTLFLVTADHGESFGEHGIYFDHWGPYEPSVDVPLIVSGYQNKRIETGIAGTMDVAPSLLELAGLTIPESYRGKSFASVVSDNKAWDREFLMIEHTDQKAFTIRDEDSKLIIPNTTDEFYPSGKELYRIKTDLDEKNNLLASNPDEAAELELKLKEYAELLTPGTPTPVLHDLVIKQLEQLGYFETTD